MLTPPIDRPSLHPGTGYLIGPRVPHGLAAVVEGLTREVLRHRPEDIYVFAADHFEKLLKLRERYHTAEYSGREFNGEFDREFNLWPTKETKNDRRPSINGWSLDKEIETLEKRRKTRVDLEESPEDMSVDREKEKTSKQKCSRDTLKRVSKKSTKGNETISDARATRIISHMSSLHSNGRNILTKDIKQELRKNKLSSEKGKTDSEKGIRGERRSKTRTSKIDKDTEEEVETTTTTTSGRTSARRPLRKVRRIETESETETERETVAKTKLENEYEKCSVKDDDANREATIIRNGSREKRSEAAARLSAHSSQRKVSSRALSMDRIRAYVLRKFASTASLEVLRSPTYVEQVQEVIDRAAPIIKEKLEEIRRPRGKRSRSVDLNWNEDSFRQHIRDGTRYDREEEEENTRKKKIERRNSGNGVEWETDIVKKKEMEDFLEMEDQLAKNGTIQDVEREEKRRRSVGSGKRSRRHESGEQIESDRIDDDSRRSSKSQQESSAARDTLEARLTSTQNILEGISMTTSELGGARRIDLVDGEHEPSESDFRSEISDQINIVSLPIVRPPSSKSCKNAARNGSDSLTLPPISPEAPRSTKKKDELSLPVLPAAGNGNHSSRKSQNGSKDAEETSTMRDVMSDIEDIAVLPKDEQQNAFVGTEQDLTNDHQKLILDVRSRDEEKNEEDEDISFDLNKKRASDISLDQSFEELDGSIRPEEGKIEEIFVDSLNVTPEIDVPMRPDSLEPNEDEQEKPVREGNIILAQGNMFDGLKDKLIEIEMAERSIEKALAGQYVTMHDDEAASEAEESTASGKISEEKKLTNEVEEIESEIEKSTDERKISSKKTKSTDEEVEESPSEVRKTENTVKSLMNEKRNSINTVEKSISGTEEVKNRIERLTNEIENPMSVIERSTNGIEEMENGIETSVNELDNLTNMIEKSTIDIEKSINEQSMSERTELNKIEKLNDGIEEAINRAKTEASKEIPIEEEKLMKKTEGSENEEEKLSNGVEELMVKRHIEYLQSTNLRPQDINVQITEAAASETDGDDRATTSRNKVEATNGLLKITAFGNATESENQVNPVENSDEMRARKRREISESLATTPLSLKIPFSYVLSEGSPCEIPDSVTTVIIPDRPCPSPVTPEIEESESRPISSLIGSGESADNCDIVAPLKGDKDRCDYGMEAFGEYIRPENAVLPVDVDFMRGVKGAKPNQDTMIVHQDLDRIKEEREEEEEEKKSDEEGEKSDAEMIARDYEVAKLEDIAEHEENEEIDGRTNIESKNANEISSSHVPECESLPDTVELIADVDLTYGERADITMESRSVPENSSEESGSSQDVCTTVSSDMRENTTSNRSTETPSADRPIVPELNLDSLQDNTVSSFKMTATKESNGSPRESEATTSLVEPLTPDERLTIGNRLMMADREEEALVKELTENLSRGLHSNISDADQLYRAEHAEYEWLEKDPLSSETDSDDKMKSQEDIIDAKDLPEDTVCSSSTLQQEKETEELESEEEIARELISSLDKDVQLHAEEIGVKEEFKDNKGSVEGNLDIDNSSQVLLESTRSISVDEAEKGEVSSKKDEIPDDERTAMIETTSEISVVDISQTCEDRDSAITDGEIEEPKLDTIEKEHLEIKQIAPLAQFEQDELLEKNDKYEMIDEKIIVENKSDTDNSHCINDQRILEGEQMSIEEVSKNQSNEDMNKDENFAEEQKDNERDKSTDQQKCDQEPLKIQEEREQKENEQEEKFKAQREDGEENLRIQEELNAKTVTSEITELRKSSMEKSIEDNVMEDKETGSIKYMIRDETASDNQMETDAEDKREEKITDFSEVEIVHGPITNAIKNYPHDRYWTTGTKSSTMETVIAAFDSDIDEKTEALGDIPEVIKDESIIQKKDDFYSAVIKLQACTRGFLARRRMRKDACPETISNNIPLGQKTATGNRLVVPEDRLNSRETKIGRQRLRREEALRKATLSLENAFATSRLQHTGEFHDSMPLPLFNTTNNETNAIPSKESSAKESEEDTEHGKRDITRSNNNEDDYRHSALDDEQEGFQKETTHFVDHPTFPIMMHLLADATRNSHFAVNSDPAFTTKTSGMKLTEPSVDILMLGYPRDIHDATLQNRYLNFITSVEDVDSSIDSLPVDDVMKSSRNIDEAHPSIASGDGSLMEPLALSSTPQGIVIEELTSLDEATEANLPSTRSESAKPSITSRPSLDTNNFSPPEERAPENKRNDLGMSSRTSTDDKGDAIECSRENTDEKTEKRSGENPVEATDCNSENVTDSRRKDEIERSDDVSHNGKEHMDEEKDEET